jgi:hypothetical protein
MAKWLIRVFLILAISFGLSYLPFRAYTDILTGYYTVIGIMFPLALTQMMTFSFIDIKNDIFVNQQRMQLNNIRSIFITLFSIATGLFFIKSINCVLCWKWIKLDLQILFSVYFVFCIIYFICNFARLATLKDEIDNEIRLEKNKSDV